MLEYAWMRSVAVFAVLITAATLPASPAQKHPALPESVTTRGCLQCHSDHVRGQVVHAATVQCGSCHEVIVEGKDNSIVLKKKGSDLCFSCHKQAEQKTVHGPYRNGACTTCHNPHEADRPNLLRATASTVCSACHVSDYRGTNVDYISKTVTLPWKKSLTKAEYDEAPKIDLDEGGVTGHPVPVHPVSGPNTRGTGQITCLTCHRQHSSDKANLVRTTDKGSSICTSCHPGMGS